MVTRVLRLLRGLYASQVEEVEAVEDPGDEPSQAVPVSVGADGKGR